MPHLPHRSSPGSWPTFLLGWLAAIHLFFVLVFLPVRTVSAAPPGLDVAAPVGRFLGGAFPGQARGYRVVDAFPSLRFRHPVRVLPVPNSGNLAVVGKEGYIWTFTNSDTTTTKQLLLNITNRVQVTDNTGFVGLAFHPQWGVPGAPNRGFLYAYYYYSPAPQVVAENVVSNGYIRLSRFTLADGATTVDPASELVLIQQYDRHDWHGGGQMHFGADGFLYLPIGDEGADNDFYNTTQQRNKGLNGGVMRLDVDNNASRSHAIRRQPIPGGTPPAGWPGSFSANYMIPNDNPWLDATGGNLEEYWCLGLRSPHTMTLDATTGRFYQGDVGQGSREELNLIAKGNNYQWAFREGDIAGPKTAPAALTGVSTPPIYAYNRTQGNCVICGPVYRGSLLPDLVGKLLFADHELGTIWALPLNASGTASAAPEVVAGTGSFGYTAGFHIGIASWGVDHNGEALMAKLAGYVDPAPGGSGQIMKLAGSPLDSIASPSTLSATGAFTNLANLAPRAGFIPFEPTEGFWSDGAAKKRWLAIPNDGTPSSVLEQIDTSTTPWQYPIGTVAMKHFDMVLDERFPTVTTKLETRFLIKATDGSWYGLSYRWRADQSDADLQPAIGSTRDLTIRNPSNVARTLRWTYPGESGCFNCHNANAGMLLGLKNYALNASILYPTTGRLANQLHTFTSLGLMKPGYTEAGLVTTPKMVNSNDYTATLENRAKAYLDANCSYCHQPNGTFVNFDLRYTTPVASMGIVNVLPSKDFGLDEQRLVAPRKTASSVLHSRLNIVGGAGNLTQMPPLGKATVDTNGALTVGEWMNTLTQSFWPGTAGIIAEYFANKTLTGNPILTRTETTLNNSWSTAPVAGLTLGNFSVRWSGYLKNSSGAGIVPQIYDYQYIYATDMRVSAGFISPNKYGKLLGSTGLYTELNGSTGVAGTYAPFTIELMHTAVSPAPSAMLRWKLSGAASYAAIPAAQFFQPGLAPDFPVAGNNSYSLNKGASQVLSVLGNDVSTSALTPSSLVIYQAPKLGSVSLNAATGDVTYTNNASLLGAKDAFIYTVKNTANKTSNRALVDLVIRTNSRIWQEANFSASQLADANVSGWYADPDADGINNLLEYTLGNSPVTKNASPILVEKVPQAGTPGLVRISYPRNATASVDVTAEASPGLQNWAADAAVTLTSTVNAQSQPIYQLSFSAASPSGSKKYARLRVSLRE